MKRHMKRKHGGGEAIKRLSNIFDECDSKL